jgi:TonB family protein
MSKTVLLSVTFALTTLTPFALADKAEFSTLYKQYTQNLESESPNDSLGKQAKALAELSKTVFGETHDNTINLTISAANHFRDAKDNKAALALYDKALGLYKKSDRDRSFDMASLLVELLYSSFDLIGYDDKTRLSEDLYQVLKNYFDEESNSQEHVLDSLNMFNHLIERGQFTTRMRGAKVLGKRLLERAEIVLPSNSVGLIRANFNYARLAEGRRSKNEAIEYYTKVIDLTSEVLDFDHPFALSSHARMVSILESKGKSEEATEHCLAIGRMKPWEDDIDATPLFRVDPTYPIAYARRAKEGSVVIKFDISPFGFVKNTSIEDSDGSLFEKEAIKALEQWRYAPKFVDGEAVEAIGQKVRLEFKLGADDAPKLKNS